MTSPPGPSGPPARPDRTDAAPDNQQGPEQDELEIEVSQLPRSAPRWTDWWCGAPFHRTSAAVPVPWYRQRVQVPCGLIATGLLMLLLLGVVAAPSLGAFLGTLGARPAPTSTPATAGALVVSTMTLEAPTASPYPSPTLIAPAIGFVPTTCPPGSSLVAFDPGATGPGIGGQGVWLVADAWANAVGGSDGTLGHSAIAHMGSLPPSEYTPVGWPVQVQVLVQSGLTQPISLTGHDLHTTYPLWFSADANNPGAIDEAAPLASIDPNQVAPSTVDGRWKIWFGVLYLPGAGCYQLQARWPGGGWTVTFAAGH